MLRLDDQPDRQLRKETLDGDLIVVGGGMAGTCAAITAARQGLRVVLVQDRPVLGGNTSSEVRLWMVGATSHMGNNNRWSREGGVLNEILMENAFRNPEGNPVLFDALLLEKVASEPTLRLLLNSAVSGVSTGESQQIESVTAFCSQNSTRYVLRAPLFCDSSGDGIVGFLAGAAFRIGVESYNEFGELLAPSATSDQLLGHSIYFYTRDTGRPVEYVAPAFALDDITEIPRYRRFNTKEQGTDLWWIEYGGSKDTVHDTEQIKWELWKIIYGVWDHIKNSGDFPDAETLTIDWVGLIPGKRESRRFEGDYMLVQRDIVEQRIHDDAVSFGGWAIDHHPVDNVYDAAEPCTQWHSKGVYQIPYRTMYSRNVPNLFLAGRIISASHVAFGSSRVMATCAHNGQAVGMAAAVCREHELQPRDLLQPEQMSELQRRLLRSGQHIPMLKRDDPRDLAQQATVTASTTLTRLDLKPYSARQLVDSRALVVPLVSGKVPECAIRVRYNQDTEITAELRTCSRIGSYTPDVVVSKVSMPLTVKCTRQAACEENSRQHVAIQQTAHATAATETVNSSGNSEQSLTVRDAELSNGEGWVDAEVRLKFEGELLNANYAFLCLMANPSVDVYESRQLVTGVTTAVHRKNAKVATSSGQAPLAGSGIDAFEFWPAERRPRGRNLAISVDLDPTMYAAENAINGFARPTSRPNAWVASQADPLPTLTLGWNEPKNIGTIELLFDPDWDHPMENIVMQHPERIMPTVVRNFRILGPDRAVLVSYRDNRQGLVAIQLKSAVTTDQLIVELDHPSGEAPASLFEIRCFSPAD